MHVAVVEVDIDTLLIAFVAAAFVILVILVVGQDLVVVDVVNSRSDTSGALD